LPVRLRVAAVRLDTGHADLSAGTSRHARKKRTKIGPPSAQLLACQRIKNGVVLLERVNRLDDGLCFFHQRLANTIKGRFRALAVDQDRFETRADELIADRNEDA
jgi:hypothetical protein